MSLSMHSISEQASGLRATGATAITLFSVLIVSLLPGNILGQDSSHSDGSPRTELIWSFETGG